ncbi:AlpA family transcriptional regulator, partial [Escherichia coli]|nr:AlpA family transcriptional regulator [Escherichia coli]
MGFTDNRPSADSLIDMKFITSD